MEVIDEIDIEEVSGGKVNGIIKYASIYEGLQIFTQLAEAFYQGAKAGYN